MTADYFYLNTRKSDIIGITVKDCSMKVETEIYYDDFVDALNDCVSDGTLRDWLIDLVQESLKNRYQLGCLPITASEFEKTNANLEELRK